MGLIVFAVLTGLISSMLYGELSAWAPKIARQIAKRAAARHPGELGARLDEEWARLLEDVPAPLSQLFLAINFAIASAKMSNDFAPVSALVRLVDIAGSTFALAFLAPIFIQITIATKIFSDGSVFVLSHMELEDGRVVSRIAFKTTRNGKLTAVGRFVILAGLSNMPSFLNVLQGNMSLVDIFRVSDGGKIVVERPGICTIGSVEGNDWISRRLRQLHHAHKMRPHLRTHILILAFTFLATVLLAPADTPPES